MDRKHHGSWPPSAKRHIAPCHLLLWSKPAGKSVETRKEELIPTIQRRKGLMQPVYWFWTLWGKNWNNIQLFSNFRLAILWQISPIFNILMISYLSSHFWFLDFSQSILKLKTQTQIQTLPSLLQEQVLVLWALYLATLLISRFYCTHHHWGR